VRRRSAVQRPLDVGLRRGNGPPHSIALEGSEVHEGFRDNRLRSGDAARAPGMPRRPDRRRSKALEDAGKTNDPLPHPALGQLVSQPCPGGPEGPMNPTRAAGLHRPESRASRNSAGTLPVLSQGRLNRQTGSRSDPRKGPWNQVRRPQGRRARNQAATRDCGFIRICLRRCQNLPLLNNPPWKQNGELHGRRDPRVDGQEA
jgi:hypothetical protein